jgi:hypothetical protein
LVQLSANGVQKVQVVMKKLTPNHNPLDNQEMQKGKNSQQMLRLFCNLVLRWIVNYEIET